MRAPARGLAAILLLIGPTLLAFFSGGFFDRPRLVAGLVVWALVAVAAFTGPVVPRTRAAAAALGGLALFAAWVALSYRWAPLGQRAQDDAERLVLYTGTLWAGIALLGGVTVRRLVEPILALGVVAVCLYALSARLLPGLVEFTASQAADGRLEQPLTYWNAMGALGAIGFVLCTRLAAAADRVLAARAAAAAATPLLGLVVYLSFSRGALLALAAGLALLVMLAPDPRGQTATAALCAIGGAIAGGVASLLPRVESLPRGTEGDTGQGLVMLFVLIALTGLAAGTAFIRGRREGEGTPVAPIVARPHGGLAVIALVLVLAGSVAGFAALEQSPDPTGTTPTTAARFKSVDSLRYRYWDIALEAFERHPLEGVGSGGFEVEWRRQPDKPEAAVDAHSLYVETLSELGMVGAVLLAVFLGGVAAAATGLHRRTPAAAAGPAAGLLAWSVHAGLDWDWEMPALTGVALLLAGAVIAWAAEPVSAAEA